MGIGKILFVCLLSGIIIAITSIVVYKATNIYIAGIYFAVCSTLVSLFVSVINEKEDKE